MKKEIRLGEDELHLPIYAQKFVESNKASRRGGEAMWDAFLKFFEIAQENSSHHSFSSSAQ
jgi:hypothetical protein